MTDHSVPLVCAALGFVAFFAALVCYSLRDFSRSRLAEICEERGKPDRFGVILKQYEKVLLACEAVFIVVLAGWLFCAYTWASGDPQGSAASQDTWLATTVKWMVIGVVLVGGYVILPWTIARVSGELLLFRIWTMLDVLQRMCQPLLSLAYRLDRILHRMSGLVEPEIGDVAALTEEIRSVVEEGERDGLIEARARTMIHRVMELQEEDVAAVMTPRTEMVCISESASLEEARQKLIEAGHSRVPVIGESPDDLIGILYAKDLLNYTSAEETQAKLADIVREPFYVPETTGIDKLLEDMKHRRVHVAIVLDEYGGVAGLVTLEDVLEEIVGEIVDEYDQAQEAPIVEVDEYTVELDARVHIDDLNEKFDYDLPEDSDYDTIGGFVFSHLGRIPEAGEIFTFRQLRFTVLEADKRRLIRLKIQFDQSLAATAAEET